MTSNTTPSGYVVSNNWGGSNAWYLFRESTSSVINHYVNNWSQIKLPIRKTLASYNIYSASSSNCATGWVIQGSNDGTTWIDLDTQSGISAWTGWKATDFSVSSPGAYLYYRLKILAVTGSYAMITSIKLFDAAGWKLSVVGAGTDPNYFAWNGDQLNIKGNILLGYGNNDIYFEDSKIFLSDNNIEYDGGYVYNYIRHLANIPIDEDHPRFIFSSLGFETDSETLPTSFSVYRNLQNRFYDYSNFTYFTELLSQDSYSQAYRFYTSESVDILRHVIVGPHYASDANSIRIYTTMPIQSPIPIWDSVTSTKTPDISTWTNPEYCPISNVWAWRKTGLSPNRVMYFRLADGHIWWVDTTEL